MMMQLLEQQKAEFASYRMEMSAALSRGGPRGEPIEPKLPKPTLQELDPKDDIEHLRRLSELPSNRSGHAACGTVDGESHGCFCKYEAGRGWELCRSQAGYLAKIRS